MPIQAVAESYYCAKSSMPTLKPWLETIQYTATEPFVMHCIAHWSLTMEALNMRSQEILFKGWDLKELPIARPYSISWIVKVAHGVYTVHHFPIRDLLGEQFLCEVIYVSTSLIYLHDHWCTIKVAHMTQRQSGKTYKHSHIKAFWSLSHFDKRKLMYTNHVKILTTLCRSRRKLIQATFKNGPKNVKLFD